MLAPILQVVLAVFLLIGGFIKVLRVPFQVEHWQHYHYPLWFMSVTGALEILGAIAMIAGLWNRYLAIGSAILFVILMLGAIHAHLFRADQSFAMAIPAGICLILSIWVIIRNVV